jgi:hypothetical protein
MAGAKTQSKKISAAQDSTKSSNTGLTEVDLQIRCLLYEALKTGVDVMITIFGDFRRKKLAFFSKTNVMINFFII